MGKWKNNWNWSRIKKNRTPKGDGNAGILILIVLIVLIKKNRTPKGDGNILFANSNTSLA